jgi:hypothetical protein
MVNSDQIKQLMKEVCTVFVSITKCELRLGATSLTPKSSSILTVADKSVPVTTAWRVLRLRMEEWPPIWRVAANILNKQPRTADKGWSSSLRVERGANYSPP